RACSPPPAYTPLFRSSINIGRVHMHPLPASTIRGSLVMERILLLPILIYIRYIHKISKMCISEHEMILPGHLLSRSSSLSVFSTPYVCPPCQPSLATTL